MLSIGKLAAGGEDYYLEAVAAGVEDYYLGAGEAPGCWLAGAGALGLEGEVAPEDLRAVLAGREPNSEQLAAAPPGRQRVPGFDLTLSDPKSVSLLHALSEPRVHNEVLAAHEAAVTAALGFAPEALARALGRQREVRLRPAEVSWLVRELLDPEGLTAQATSFSRREVLRALAERAGPGAGAAELEATADNLLGSRRVVPPAERGADGEPRYTTPDLVQVERELMRVALSRQGGEACVVDQEVVAEAIARRPALSDEQRTMVERLTRGGDGLALVLGRAGAGKVLVGDDAQLPEIAAGGASRGLAARLDPIRLEGNRRQREPWERQALVDLREGRPERTVAAYVLAGRVTIAETAEEARERLVADWVDARRRGGDCLVIAARRRDARDLSRRARAALMAAGKVSGPALGLPSGEFAVGDQVMTLRNRRALGVQNGMRATVAMVDLEAGTLTVVTDDGRRLELSRAYLEAGHLAHGYAVTAQKAQGLTVERAFVLGGDEVYREWGYTALSRAREATRLYLVGEPLRELVADDLGGRHAAERREPLEELAADLARSRARELAIDIGD